MALLTNVLFNGNPLGTMSYVVVDLNMFRDRELPTLLKSLPRDAKTSYVAVEGHAEITRDVSNIPCTKVFTANPDVLHRCVRPGVGVLCTVPASPEDEHKLASFIAEYVGTHRDDRESFLKEWSFARLNISQWSA